VARGLSAEGANKNRDRLDSIKKAGGAIRSVDLDPLNPSAGNANSDLEYLSKRNLNQLDGGEE
jgi:hypothetical protein